MQKLFKIVYVLFIVTVFGLGLLLIASIAPIPGNYDVKIVQSGSMEPAIRTGAIVFVKPLDSYKVGDVITFGEDTKTKVPTTHRIVSDRVEDGEFIYTTKGDANEDQDPGEVRKSEVIGKVLFSIPFLGYLLDFAKKPIGFVLLIGIPAVVVVADEVGSIWKEIKKARRKDTVKDKEGDTDKNVISENEETNRKN